MRISLSTGWQRCRGCLVFRGHFPQKSPMISGSFAERNLQMKAFYASSPPCSESNSQKSALQLFSAKEPLIIGLFCGKRLRKIRYPMYLRHSVSRAILKNQSLRLFSPKEPSIIGLFCGKRLPVSRGLAA